MNWKQLQENSSSVLASGLSTLTKSKPVGFDSTFSNDFGNYLISVKDLKYIGEAKSLNKRLKQQSKEDTSTFYKNYYKHYRPIIVDKSNDFKLKDFSVRTINTKIGRKEIEEFGIVNLPADLNRFQRGKRIVYTEKFNKTLWQEVQENYADLLNDGEKNLKRIKLIEWSFAQPKSSAGIYWIEHPKFGIIYIGESSGLSKRIATHSGRTYFSALRRNLGESIFKFKLQTINGKKRYFKSSEDEKISNFLRSSYIRYLPVHFGRFELEEYLIKKYKPVLNRKENKD